MNTNNVQNDALILLQNSALITGVQLKREHLPQGVQMLNLLVREQADHKRPQ